MSRPSQEPPRGPTPIGDILQSYLHDKERDSLAPYQKVVAAWSRLAVPAAPRGTRVAGYRAGVVTVEVKSPPAFAELAQFHRRSLLEGLRREVASEVIIKDLRFRLGAW